MKAFSYVALIIEIAIPFAMAWNYVEYGQIPWHALWMMAFAELFRRMCIAAHKDDVKREEMKRRHEIR